MKNILSCVAVIIFKLFWSWVTPNAIKKAKQNRGGGEGLIIFVVWFSWCENRFLLRYFYLLGNYPHLWYID